MPIFIKQSQCFANKHNLLCEEKLCLRENSEVWTNICIVCYNRLDFLTRAVEQLSFATYIVTRYVTLEHGNLCII